MPWKSQFTKLILSYYREDPEQLQALQCLSRCKVSRRWGVLRINCQTEEDANTLTQASAILGQPIAALRVARHIKILLHGSPVGTFDVQGCRFPSNPQGDDADLLL